MFETLAAGIKEVQEFDPPIAGGQTFNKAILELEQLLSKLEAAVAEKEALWKHRGCWRADNARSAATWLAGRTGKHIGEGRRRMRHGDLFLDAPQLQEASADGTVSGRHLDVLERARTPVTEEMWKESVPMFIEWAKTALFRDFEKAVKYWHQHADPDGTESAAAKRDASRNVKLAQSLDDDWYGSLRLDPIGGTILRDELRRIEQELYEEEKKAGDVVRTSAQRRADALVEMARRSRSAPPDGRRPAPLFSVLIGHESVERLCELTNGTVITPGQLLPWLEMAYVERILYDAKSRVIDVGVEQRLFTGATRKAVLLQDRGCFETHCDAPIDECQVDHIIPYSEGGLTVTGNGRPACGFHNRAEWERRPRSRIGSTPPKQHCPQDPSG